MSNCECAVVPNCPTLHRRYSPYCRMVEVSAYNPQVYFTVAPSIRFSNSALTFNRDRVYLELRRKGCENLLATYSVWRRDLNGNIGFYFDDTLFGQPPGYFIGDVYINCTYCFSVQLRLSPCEAVVTDCYVQPIMETCGKGECGVIQVVGIGSIGGLSCAVTSDCGPIAPYFPLDNPATPPQAQLAQCCIPATSAGTGSIGE